MIFFFNLLFLWSMQGFVLDSFTINNTDKEAIRHSVFIAGPDFTGIIDENENVVWDSGKKHARDGFVLPNGHVLICWADEVKEFDNKKEVVFTFERANKEDELGTAQRLPNGNTLITQSGKNPQLLEVDKNGKIVLSIPLQPETDNTHMQTRMARKLANGNYLVPHLLAFSVKEYDVKGNVLGKIETDIAALGGKAKEPWPFTAIKLKNGNTLVSLTHSNQIAEFDTNGKLVWKVSNEDIAEKPFKDPCGLQRLPNGHTVVASYGANEGIRLFEINKKNKIVWSFNKYKVHEFQILTTNGKAIAGIPLK